MESVLKISTGFRFISTQVSQILFNVSLNCQTSENIFYITIISRQLTKNRNKIKFGFRMYEI